MQLRPASLSSKFHKQLTAESQKKHVRVNKVKATATVADPNRAKAEREKAEESRIKSKENLQRKQVGGNCKNLCIKSCNPEAVPF